MDRPASAITLQSGEVQRFHNHTLARKSRVTVQQHRKHEINDLRPSDFLLLRESILLGPNHSFDHRVDRLEVAGIWRQCQTNFLARGSYALTRSSLVILHIAFVSRKLGMHGTFKRREDPLTQVTDDVS